MAERFDDLTDDEVLLLTSTEIQEWIDLECAEAGVPLLPERPVEPMDVRVTPDVTVFGLAGMHFENQDDANAALAFLDGLKRVEVGYVHGPRFEQTFKGPAGPLSITPLRVFTLPAWNQIAAVANAAAVKKTEYNAAFAEYDKIERARKATIDGIQNRFTEIHRRERAREAMRGHFSRYMTLAKGNRVTAIRFLKDAYPSAGELLPELEIPPPFVPPADRLYNPDALPEL
jgi:hypothetical protein